MRTTIKTNVNTSREEIFEFDVPKMIGTQKQADWAIEIFVDMMTSLCGMCSGKMGNPKIKKQYDEILSLFQTQTDATFWIENRDGNFQSVARKLL